MGESIFGIDLELVDPKSSQDAIIKACVKCWFQKGPNNLMNYSDCSGFVKSVQQALLLRPFIGRANSIFDEVEQRIDWEVLGVGTSAVTSAGAAANHGFLTIAIWKNSDPMKDGHVMIITSYLNSIGYTPEQHSIGAWGVHNSVGSTMSRLSASFAASKHKDLKYAKCVVRPIF
jgi:hypothetical protein